MPQVTRQDGHGPPHSTRYSLGALPTGPSATGHEQETPPSSRPFPDSLSNQVKMVGGSSAIRQARAEAAEILHPAIRQARAEEVDRSDSAIRQARAEEVDISDSCMTLTRTEESPRGSQLAGGRRS